MPTGPSSPSSVSMAPSTTYRSGFTSVAIIQSEQSAHIRLFADGQQTWIRADQIDSGIRYLVCMPNMSLDISRQ
jgi:hypothetical protein